MATYNLNVNNTETDWLEYLFGFVINLAGLSRPSENVYVFEFESPSISE